MRCHLFLASIAFALGSVPSWNAAAQDSEETYPCSSPEAKLLAADAERATEWNWGWGSIYAGATIVQSGVALWTDDRDLKVGLWTGAAKSSLGVLNQLIFPKRIAPPGPQCKNLASKVLQAREVEDRGHGWLAHGTVVAANVTGFAIVAGITENYVLATSGLIIGTIVGEIAIYTGPDRLRARGFGRVGLVPRLGASYSGFAVHGAF